MSILKMPNKSYLIALVPTNDETFALPFAPADRQVFFDLAKKASMAKRNLPPSEAASQIQEFNDCKSQLMRKYYLEAQVHPERKADLLREPPRGVILDRIKKVDLIRDANFNYQLMVNIDGIDRPASEVSPYDSAVLNVLTPDQIESFKLTLAAEANLSLLTGKSLDQTSQSENQEVANAEGLYTDDQLAQIRAEYKERTISSMSDVDPSELAEREEMLRNDFLPELESNLEVAPSTQEEISAYREFQKSYAQMLGNLDAICEILGKANVAKKDEWEEKAKALNGSTIEFPNLFRLQAYYDSTVGEFKAAPDLTSEQPEWMEFLQADRTKSPEENIAMLREKLMGNIPQLAETPEMSLDRLEAEFSDLDEEDREIEYSPGYYANVSFDKERAEIVFAGHNPETDKDFKYGVPIPERGFSIEDNISEAFAILTLRNVKNLKISSEFYDRLDQCAEDLKEKIGNFIASWGNANEDGKLRNLYFKTGGLYYLDIDPSTAEMQIYKDKYPSFDAQPLYEMKAELDKTPEENRQIIAEAFATTKHDISLPLIDIKNWEKEWIKWDMEGETGVTITFPNGKEFKVGYDARNKELQLADLPHLLPVGFPMLVDYTKSPQENVEMLENKVLSYRIDLAGEIKPDSVYLDGSDSPMVRR